LLPASGPRHEAKLLRWLGDIACAPPKPSPCPIPLLLEPARQACEQLYPELFESNVLRRYTPVQHWRRFMGWLTMPAGLIALGLWWLSRLISPADFQRILGISVGISIVLFLGWCVWFFLIQRKKRRKGFQETKRRYELAHVIAAAENLGVQGPALLMENDAMFTHCVQQFLIDHEVPYARPLHDEAGRYVFSSTGKIQHLVQAILASVSRAKDNELFLLSVDLFEVENVELLLSAIKAARSRHHDVIIAAPWPSELADPTELGDPTQLLAPHEWAKASAKEGSTEQVSASLIEHYFRSYELLRRELGRLGVALILARPGRSVSLIMERVEAIRSARIHARHR
jgi:hypothetical protein